MAKLEITVSKEQFDALDDSLKTFYTATQDGKGYELEGIGSIQRALAEEKAKKSTKPELVSEVEELRKFKQEQEAAALKLEEDRARKEGEFDKLLETKEQAWKERIESEATKNANILNNLKREKLTNLLVEKGALPDRAKYLLGDLDATIDLVSDDSGFTLKKKGGIGDADELNAMFENVKAQSPFFFASTTASGSGASASESGGSTAKSVTRSQWDAATTEQRAEWGLAVAVTD